LAGREGIPCDREDRIEKRRALSYVICINEYPAAAPYEAAATNQPTSCFGELSGVLDEVRYGLPITTTAP
jgi:hypothetical protein